MIVPILGAAASLSAANAARAASVAALGAGHGSQVVFEDGGQLPPRVENSDWIGIQCCPACKSPIGGRLPKCCPSCGHTESVYIHTLIRAGRYVNGEWVWKDGGGSLPARDLWMWLPIWLMLAFIFGVLVAGSFT